MKKYLVIGTGGVGGSIAGFLALAGKDVTCIARGKHLEAIRKYGLHLKSDLKGEHYLPVKACTAEEYNDKADVVLSALKATLSTPSRTYSKNQPVPIHWLSPSSMYTVPVPVLVALSPPSKYSTAAFTS